MKSLLPLLGLAAAGAAIAASAGKSATQGGSGGNTPKPPGPTPDPTPSEPLVVQPGGAVYPTNVGEWIVLETEGKKFQDVSVWDQATAELAPASHYQVANDPETGDLLFSSNIPLKTVKFVIYAQVEGTDQKLAWTVDYSEVDEDDIPDLGNSPVFNVNQGSVNVPNFMVAGGVPRFHTSRIKTTLPQRGGIRSSAADRIAAGRRR